jgi:hypothetical protein
MSMHKAFFTKALFSLALTGLLAPALAFGQARTARVASNKSLKVPACSGAWTGTITYTRTQSKSDSKKVERVSGRGHDSRNWEMKYEYGARVSVLEAPERNGSSKAVAMINHTFSSNEKIDAVERNSCDRGKTWKEMKGTSTSETRTSGPRRPTPTSTSASMPTAPIPSA